MILILLIITVIVAVIVNKKFKAPLKPRGPRYLKAPPRHLKIVKKDDLPKDPKV